MNIRDYPGWIGGHSREQVPGAIPNGTRVRKVKTEPVDTHPIGAEATVLGSIAIEHPELGVAYFVEWDAKPKVAVLVVSWKIAPIEEAAA
jgi:hypothetical protein